MNAERNFDFNQHCTFSSDARAAADLFIERIVAEFEKSDAEIAHLKQLLAERKTEVVPIRRRKRANLGRIGQGIKTPVESFYGPVLQALTMGGGALPRSRVLVFVKNAMKNNLNSADYGVIRSSNTPRWENSVDQARQKLIEMGLMKASERKAIWEITQEGRDWFTAKIADR